MTETIAAGSWWLAAAVAVAAGVMSFASPCVLPLVPSYLGYVSSSVSSSVSRRRRGSLLLGAGLFVLGFSVVFVSYGALFGGLGAALTEHRAVIERLLGVIVILLGVGFMGGISWLQRDRRPHSWAATGRIGAVVLGIAFGLGWSPCVGPALAAVQSLAFNSATAARGAMLSLCYCLGLGLPFLLIASLGERLARSTAFLRRHTRVINLVGGAMLAVLGLLLVTGAWADVVAWLQGLLPVWTPPW